MCLPCDHYIEMKQLDKEHKENIHDMNKENLQAMTVLGLRIWECRTLETLETEDLGSCRAKDVAYQSIGHFILD